MGNQKRWEKRRKEREMDEGRGRKGCRGGGGGGGGGGRFRFPAKSGEKRFLFPLEKEGKPSDAGVTQMLQQIGTLELFPA